MAAGGRDRIITALLSMPKLGARAYIAALPSVIKEQEITENWRKYVGDCLVVLTENTAKHVEGSYIRTHWADIISSKPKDTRSGAEIAADIIKKTGLTLVPSE